MAKRKNPAAVTLGKLGGAARAKSLSQERQTEIGRAAGKLGGAARAKALTKKQRSEIASKAAKARWAKAKK